MSSDRFGFLEYDNQGDPVKGDAPPVNQTEPRRRDPTSLLEQARKHFVEGDFEPALRQYSAALSEDTMCEEAWAAQVRCLVYMDQLKEALVWAQKAYAHLPSSPLVMSAQALAIAGAGHPIEGLQLSDAALKVAQESRAVESSVWLERGACLLIAGDLLNGQACMEKVREMHPDDADWLQRMGAQHLQWGEPAMAASEFARALELRPDRAYLWLMSSRTARRLGLKKKADAELTKAISLRPDYREALKEQDRLWREVRQRKCWIATLVFGDEAHPTVQALRRWRTRSWLPTWWGRAAARFYDLTAPSVCVILQSLPALQPSLRWLLRLLVSTVEREAGPVQPGRGGEAWLRRSGES